MYCKIDFINNNFDILEPIADHKKVLLLPSNYYIQYLSTNVDILS